MKMAVITMTTPTQPPLKLPYIGKGDFDASIILFVSSVSNASTYNHEAQVKGVVLEPGAGTHKVGDWVTYLARRYPPLVGTVTLEN